MSIFKSEFPDDEDPQKLVGNKSKRIYGVPSVGKSDPTAKQLLVASAVEYLENERPFSIMTSEGVTKQAEVMYDNSYMMCEEFVMHHFQSQLRTQYRFGKETTEAERLLLGRMLDLRFEKAIASIGTDDPHTAIIPFHHMVNSWGSKKMIAYVIKNLGARASKSHNLAIEVRIYICDRV